MQMSTRQKQMSSILSNELRIKTPEDIKDGLFKYVEVKNNRYCLNISEKECLKMGISPLEYRKVVVDLGKINRLVAESERFKGQKIDLRSSQKILFSSKTSGYISTSDLQAVKEKIFIPAGYTKIRYHSCRPRASMITVISCGISVMGNLDYDSVFASVFTTRSTVVALKSNNCEGELFFQVGDANGGSGSWELIK